MNQKPQPKRAVSLADLLTWKQREGSFCGPIMLLTPVLTEESVECEKGRFDGYGLRVKEDTDPERWAAIVSLIRETWEIGKAGLRIYESKTGNGGWKRV